jgi:hypothetical protein
MTPLARYTQSLPSSIGHKRFSLGDRLENGQAAYQALALGLEALGYQNSGHDIAA